MAAPPRKHVPGTPLSAFVKCFWYWEAADAPARTHVKEILLPNGEPTVVINLREEPIRVYDPGDFTRFDSHRRAVLSGARTTPIVIDTSAQERVFGIQFHPGGVFPFLGFPASELANRSADLESLWRHSGELREGLLAAPTIAAMFSLGEQYLLAQLLKPLELHPAVRFARRQFSQFAHEHSVARVLGSIGLSQRHFIRLFREQIGLAPKAFCRVRRFQRILETVNGETVNGVGEVDWANVAIENGYYDQAHFCHDFREFSGLTPTQYAVRATKHLNHVPVR